MKKQKLAKNCILFFLLAALMLSGCGTTTPEPEPDELPDGVTVGNPVQSGQALDDVFSLNCSKTESMNPLSGANLANLSLAGLIYETLFTVGMDYSFTPSRLVKEYSTEDGKTWVFTIDTQVQFSDGTALRAQDVVYTLRRAMQSKLYKPRLDNYSVIYGISALNEESFMVTLHQENRLFPALLTVPILKEGDFNTPCPVGTGLYKMEGAELWNGTEDKPESDEAPSVPTEPRLTVNRLHPDAGSAPADTIYLQEHTETEDMISAFEDGLVDLMENDPNGMYSTSFGSSHEVRSYTSTSMYYLGFNMTSEFVLTAQYRYALNYLIDRKTISQKLMQGGGVAAVSPIVPVSELYDASIENVIHYAPETALTALERGGCADHDDDGKLEYMVTGIPMEINIDFIVNIENSTKVAIARRIVEDLAAVGITVTLHELNWADYVLALDEGEFDMYFGEVMLTADFNLSALLTADGSLNYGGVEDAGYAARIVAFLAADEAKRAAACSDMCQYIVANAPIIPIVFENREVVSHRGVISGVTLSPYNLFHNISEWTIQTD